MSTIRVDNFGPSAGGTTYSARGIAKAWVNFNGTGTIAARDSENVSSLTDNGGGDYTVNWTNAFGAGDYAPVFGCQADQIASTNNGNVYGEIARFSNALQTSSARICWGIGGINGKYDPTMATAVFHGDLA